MSSGVGDAATDYTIGHGRNCEEMKQPHNIDPSSQPDEQFAHGLQRAEQMVASRDYEQAAELFHQLIHQIPVGAEWERAHVGLSECHHALGSVTEVIPLLIRALRARPNSEALLCLLAENYALQRQFGRAVRELERGLTRGCRGPLIHRCLAEMFLQQEKPDEAIEECRRSLEQDVNQGTVYEILAEAHMQRGQNDEAIAALRGALATDPDDPRYYLRIAGIHRQQGCTGEAAAILREGRQRCPYAVEIGEALLECLHDLGSVGAVIDEALAIHKRVPRNLFVLDVLTFAYMQKGDLRSAERTIRQTLAISPLDGLNRLKLASLYHQEGSFSRAREEYERVLHSERQGALREEVQRALDAIDECQLQQIAMLVAENPVFRVKLGRDPDSALKDYSFCLSEPSVEYLKSMMVNGLMEGGCLRHGGTVH